MQVQSKIKKLDDHLINQIAAGEVVERPASALKEIIENSIDAGATEVTVELEHGGKTLIRVGDNGHGLAEHDLPLVFERHATSKIQNLEDLQNNLHLGFRGEALAAISSVSNIEFASRSTASEHGVCCNNTGQISSVAMNVGTRVVIKDLFFNTQARLKYLKTDASEYKNCLDVFTNYALAHPSKQFTLVHNHKQIFQLKPEPLAQRAQKLLGLNFESDFLAISYFSDNIKISGFICRPQQAVAKLPSQFFFVNGRPIKARNFSHAVLSGYGSWIFGSEKPQFIICMELSPESVDMNVHPRKLEAKFHLESKLYGLLRNLTKQTLQKHSLTPSVSKSASLAKFIPSLNTNETESESSSNFSPSSNQNMSPYTSTTRRQGTSRYLNLQNHTGAAANFHSKQATTLQATQDLQSTPDLQAATQLDLAANSPSELQQEQGLKALSQVQNSYIIAEGPNDIFIIDQHAAHERICYDILATNAQKQSPQSQPLLVPSHLTLKPSHLETLKEAESILEKIGFEFLIKDNLLSIHAVPSKLSKINLKELITNLLEDLKQNQNFENLQELEEIVINFTACRTAIKFGQKLEPAEMQGLLDDMQALEHKKYTCPHGRPAIIKLGMQDLEKLFKRIH
jgi:DNA mismatch repair protein MutL